MLEKIFSTLLFLIIYLTAFSSLAGYGLILNKFIYKIKFNNDDFKLALEGFVLLTILSFLIYLFIGFNKYLNLIILAFGALFYFINFGSFEKIKKNYIFLLIFFIGLLISKTHEDFWGYHFLHLEEITSKHLQLGLGNLDPRFTYSSIFAYIQALFYIPFFNFKLFHLPVYLIYVSLIGHLYYLIKNEINKNQLLLWCTLFSYCVIKFTRLSEYGYDYIAQFILIYAFIQIVQHHKKILKEKFIIVNNFLLAVCIKISSILFLPILFLIFSKDLFTKKMFKELKINSATFLISFLILFCLLGNSFIKTGCVFYPITKTCISKKLIYWSIDKNQIFESSELNAKQFKGFFIQSNNKLDSKKYLSNYNWVSNWIDKHYFYKINEHVLIIISLYLLIYFFLFGREKNINFAKENFKIIILSFVSTFWWFSSIPQLRFGTTVTFIFLFYILFLFLKKISSFSIKKFKVFFIILILFFNLKNFKRINDEFKRNDIYQYKNFPWFYLPDLDTKNLCLINNDENRCNYKVVKIQKGKYFDIIIKK